MSGPTDRAKAVDLIYAWDDDDSGTYDDLAELITTALAAERAAERARWQAVLDVSPQLVGEDGAHRGFLVSDALLAALDNS